MQSKHSLVACDLMLSVLSCSLLMISIWHFVMCQTVSALDADHTNFSLQVLVLRLLCLIFLLL